MTEFPAIMRTVKAAALVAILLAATAASRPPYVIDGDTLAFGRERVRVANLDAPDIGSHAGCAQEQRLGAAARSFARSLIRSARRIEIIERQGRDRYGRTLARVLVDGSDFGQTMIAARHGRPWRGRSSDWCRGSG